MRILLINHYAGSTYHGMEFRAYYMSRELVRMGHEVVIVAASFSHLRQKNPDVYDDIQEEIIDGIRYIWIKTSKYAGNGIERIKNMLCFIRKLYKYLPKIAADFKPDFVIASSTYPLDSYPARWIAKKHSVKFAFELHDLWPMSPQVLGHMSKWHPFIMVMQMSEDYWCRNADVVISLLPDAYKHLVTRGMKMEKYHVVPNGVDVSEWTGAAESLPQEHKTCIEGLKERGKFIVGYVGGHGVSNGLDTIVDLAARFASRPNIQFVMVGKGSEKDRLINRVNELGLLNMTFLPPVSKKVVPTLLEFFNVLICVSPNTPLHQFGMSLNKMFDYMMSAKPILWSANVSNDIVSEARCGFTVASEDVNALEKRLLELISMTPQSLADIGNNGKIFVLANYTYPTLSQKFIKALEGERLR